SIGRSAGSSHQPPHISLGDAHVADASGTVHGIEHTRRSLEAEHGQGKALVQALGARQAGEAITKLASHPLLHLTAAIQELSPEWHMPEPAGGDPSNPRVPP